MPSSLALKFAGLILTGLIFRMVLDRLRGTTSRRRHPLPPGPKLDPIVGHQRLIDAGQPWISYAEWGRQWGDIISSSIYGTPIVVLNSVEAARDLLDKRGAIYSDRPPQVLWGDTLGWSNMMNLMHYGDAWRRQRRLMQQFFNSQSVKVFEACQVEQAYRLLGDLYERPKAFAKCLDRFSASLIVKAAYGYDIEGEDDPLASLAIEATDLCFVEGAPGGSMVDVYPALRFIPSWFPGFAYKKRWPRTAQKVSDMISVPFAIVQKRRESGIATPDVSFVDSVLSDFEATNEETDEQDRHAFQYDIACIAALACAGGVETTGATLATFLLMLARHPEVVKKAQTDIDQVTGRERLPMLIDRKNIPYIDCIMKEVFRFNTHDNGRRLLSRQVPYQAPPEGAYVMPNIWNMLRDERFFPDAEVFQPDRFRSKVEGMKDNLKSLNGQMFDDPSSLVFGFGRRICPGRFFADSAIWLAMAQLLAVFDVSPPRDEGGRPKLPELAFAPRTVLHPKPFECEIKPRDDIAKRLIRGGSQA